jgi:hypothetical protein
MQPEDLVIVSMHEKGFPSADLYIGANWDDDLEGVAPDGFFTMKRGDTIEAACERAKEKWPGARVMVAEDPEPEDDES